MFLVLFLVGGAWWEDIWSFFFFFLSWPPPPETFHLEVAICFLSLNKGRLSGYSERITKGCFDYLGFCINTMKLAESPERFDLEITCLFFLTWSEGSFKQWQMESSGCVSLLSSGYPNWLKLDWNYTNTICLNWSWFFMVLSLFLSSQLTHLLYLYT